LEANSKNQGVTQTWLEATLSIYTKSVLRRRVLYWL